MKKLISLFILLTTVFYSCNENKAVIMTVTGEVDASSLGATLPHEHILVDFIGADSTGYHRWDREKVKAKMLPYLVDVKNKGLNTFVDCTPAYLGRDPLLLKQLSQSSGLLILTNTGYYGAMGNKFLPQHFSTLPVDSIVKIWTDEWVNGIENTGIRPGFIKIAVANDAHLSELHQKLVTAAARTHLLTGLIINSHTGPNSPAFEQIEILRKEGVDPSAFIWTHANRGTVDSMIIAAKQGVWVSLDKLDESPETLKYYAETLTQLKQAKVLNKVLVSHDAGWYDVVQGDTCKVRGYTAIYDNLIPLLKQSGFTHADFLRLLVKNPSEAYTIRVRKFVKKI